MADTKRATQTEMFPQEPVAKQRRAAVEMRGLRVEQVDIDNAMRADSNSCMIADAIYRQVKDVRNVTVDLATVRLTDGKGRRLIYLTPLSAQRGLCRFDLGEKPEPFEFNLKAAQVTEAERTETVVDENGNRKRRRKQPSRKVTIRDDKRAIGNKLVVGGRAPLKHSASARREFGVRAFTWTDDEDPKEVAKRVAKRYERGRPKK